MSDLYRARIRHKRDTSANWTQHDPVILDGEIILVDTDSGELRAKIGDGVKKYTQLPFSDETLRNLINNKANNTEASESAAGLMSASDKTKVNRMPLTTKVNGILYGSGWVGQADGTFTQTMIVGGLTSDNDILVSANNSYLKTYMSMGCRCISQVENELTFECTNPQEVDIPIGIIIHDFDFAMQASPSITLSNGVLNIT